MLWKSNGAAKMDTSVPPVINVDVASFKSIADKTIIVTGASSGIGLETAEYFYELGCNVVFVGGRKLPDTYVDLKSPRVLVCKCDISSWESQVEIFEAAKAKFGHIDIVCLNAGVAEPRGQFFDVKVDTESGKPMPLDLRVFDVDLKGTAYGLGLSFHYLKDRGGSVIMVTSRAGYGGNEIMPGYSASKNGTYVALKSYPRHSASSNNSRCHRPPSLTGRSSQRERHIARHCSSSHHIYTWCVPAAIQARKRGFRRNAR